MNILWVTIGLTIAGVWAYIQHLLGKVSDHETTIAVLQNKSKTQEWDREINEATRKVVETEIDYNKTRDDFRKRYGDGSGNGTPS